MNSLTRFAIKFRIPVCILFLAVTGFFGRQIPNLQLDPGIKKMLPDSFPSRTTLDSIEEVFGGSEMLIVILDTDNGILNSDTLQRIKDISLEMEEIPGIEKIISLSTMNSINGTNGELIIKNLLRNTPKTHRDMENLKRDIEQNSIIIGKIVTRDFTKTAILGSLTPDSDEALITNSIDRLIAEFPGQGRIHIGGLPYLRGVIADNMQKDLARLMPIGLLIMVIFLFLCFRDLRGVILPFLIVLMSIIVAFGSLEMLGWSLQMPLIILPVILIAIANDYGIHLIARYQYEIQQWPDGTSPDKHEVIVRMNKSLGKPVFVAGLTTIAGFLTLYSHIVEAAKHLGVIASIGIAFALVGSILFIPAVLSIFPLAKKRTIKTSQGLIAGALKAVGRIVVTRPGRVTVFSLAIVIVISLGINKLLVDTSLISFFSPKSEAAVADAIIDKDFGGNTSISLMVEGDIKDPEIMKEMDSVIKDMEQDKDIGSVTSIASVVKQLNKVLNYDDPAYFRIPDTREEIAQLLELYSFGGDPDDFEKMLSFDYDKALITAQISSPSMKTLAEKLDYIKTKTGNNDYFTLAGGFGEIMADLAAALVRGQIISLTLSIVLITVIVGFLFRSLKSALLSALPIIIAVLTLMGLMGFMKIELSIVTTMLTSIMVGAGVDYTIHFLWHYREAVKVKTAKDAVMETLHVSGKAIVFNAFSVIIGCTPLLFSNFLPVKFFGFLITVSISTCLLGALVFLPSLLLLITGRHSVQK